MKLFFLFILTLGLVGILAACTPYNGQLYSQNSGAFQHPSAIRPSVAAPPPPPANRPIVRPPLYQNGQVPPIGNEGHTGHPRPHRPPPGPAQGPGVQALFYCTEELGYNPAFNENDYQNCLQLNQAMLTDYAFNLLKDYLLTWADFAIDAALQALGFTNGRSYVTTETKSSQLTSIISSSYRWYD